MKFYRRKLGLELATELREPQVAFYWLGERGKSMLGLWETGPGPQRMSLQVAFTARLEDVIASLQGSSTERYSALGFCADTQQAGAIARRSVAVYFHNPGDNLRELLALSPGKPRPEAGVVLWSQWKKQVFNQLAY